MLILYLLNIQDDYTYGKYIILLGSRFIYYIYKHIMLWDILKFIIIINKFVN